MGIFTYTLGGGTYLPTSFSFSPDTISYGSGSQLEISGSSGATTFDIGFEDEHGTEVASGLPSTAQLLAAPLTVAGLSEIVDNSEVSLNSESVLLAATSVSAAPEPGAWALMLGGVGMLGAFLRMQQARRREDEAKDIASA